MSLRASDLGTFNEKMILFITIVDLRLIIFHELDRYTYTFIP